MTSKLNSIVKTAATLLLAVSVSGTIGCSVAGPAADELNPYGQGNNIETLGSRDQKALNGGSKAATSARQALEVAGSMRRAAAPQPYNPVINPAEVRLMWVPDHLNRFGDLVPAHYYYLKVKKDTWELQDAFDIEAQLTETGAPAGGGGVPSGPSVNYGASGAAGGTPWVYKDQ